MVAQQTLTLYVEVRILLPLPDVASEPGAIIFEVWLSLVERYVRDVEVGGSNPLTSTKAPDFAQFVQKSGAFSFLLFPSGMRKKAIAKKQGNHYTKDE